MTAPVVEPQGTEPQGTGTDPAGAEDKTFTQAELDRIVADRVKRAKPADYDDLRRKAGEFDKLADANKSDLEKLTARAEQAERERGEVTARALRLEVAFEKGLTPAQAKRLVGNDKAELEADADEILRDFPALKNDGRPRGDVDQGVRSKAAPSNPRQADLEQIEADLRSRKPR